LGTHGNQSTYAKYANYHVTVAPTIVEQERKTSLATNAMRKLRGRTKYIYIL
jgi:hypothetical protein